jgi:gamma-glutamyl:cysteine ligase YbdK (ATP-grasp superfamily)
MGISFSSSLFGLAGSLVLGFLDLQSSQAQNRFYTDLEDWLSTTVRDLADGAAAAAATAAPGDMRGAIDRLKEVMAEGGSNRAATTAMANLAEAIQGMVHHMRQEQQLIRNWADAQAEQNNEMKRLLEIIARESTRSN